MPEQVLKKKRAPFQKKLEVPLYRLNKEVKKLQNYTKSPSQLEMKFKAFFFLKKKVNYKLIPLISIKFRKKKSNNSETTKKTITSVRP